MSANRIVRINEEITKNVADLIRTLKDPRISGLISITKVDTAGDLGSAKIYVSILGEAKQQKDTIKGLTSAAGWLRRELGQRMELRSTPELHFIADDSLNRGSHIIELMGKLDKEKAEHGDR